MARNLHADGLVDLEDVDFPADLIQHPELVDPDLWLYQYLPVSLCRQVSSLVAMHLCLQAFQAVERLICEQADDILPVHKEHV